ncbi:cytochrome P450 [Punctularia strigosozonata HHB-11173 SS5]|uniref:cytochrome P450 n=1 Tax=Punctularia strigosozonata (strain HHB-11173) TaxID=741275 RepID=UPI00044182BD|nr:cytochrome P450 [Punctularia strigosozonata HHB-11173 SS5]EIN05687.1 cytochrome P450 [Punctularia strigosozonata HHB-11173 SS5]
MRQRRLIQPAFQATFVHSLTPVFSGCAYILATRWKALMNEHKVEKIDMNVYQWIELLTMESLGRAAFGVEFNSIAGEQHELMQAYRGIISRGYSRPTKIEIALQALALRLPPWILSRLDCIPTKRMRQLRAAKSIAEDDKTEDRDLLSVLVRAGEPDERGKLQPMTDQEIYDQLTTSVVAGFETVGNTTNYGLYELARNPDIQRKLFAEVSQVLEPMFEDENQPGFDYAKLNAMPYLNAFVKEVLRVHSPVSYGLFQARVDDVIPLSNPIPTPNGPVKQVPISAGQRIFVALDGANHHPDIWGTDVDEFKPERWLIADPAEIRPEQRIGGPYDNIASFGGGPKTCLGWRFAVVELQSFLAVLVREYEFDLISKEYQLWKDGCFVAPAERGKADMGPRLPLRITRRSNR